MKKVLRHTAKGLAVLVLLVVLYFLAATIGSIIPVNKTATGSSNEEIIFLRTNGVHTSIIFPLKNEITDWTEIVDIRHTLSGKEDFKFVSFGWGDLEFYRNTPQWSDLSFPVAFRALFLKSPSALNVEFYEQMFEDEDTFSVEVSFDEYKQLAHYVKESFDYGPNGKARVIRGLHYNRKDAFYHARDTFHLFYTCNTWTNNALKTSGLRACLWTPFDIGIFYQYR